MDLRQLARDALCARWPRLALALAARGFALGAAPWKWGPLRIGPQELGWIGEELAARALVRAGWRIEGRRVQTPCGEVDLLAGRGRERAVVEVKAARLPEGLAPGDERFPPGVRLDDRRLARLRRAALYLGVPGARVDLFEVVVPARGGPIELRHHPALLRPLRPKRASGPRRP